MDEATKVRKGEELDSRKVETFLRDVIPGLEGEMAIQQFPSGASNLTYLVTVGEREMVLRRPPFGTKAKTAHDMGREYKVLKALGPVYPYCPRPLSLHRRSRCDGVFILCHGTDQGYCIAKGYPGITGAEPRGHDASVRKPVQGSL